MKSFETRIWGIVRRDLTDEIRSNLLGALANVCRYDRDTKMLDNLQLTFSDNISDVVYDDLLDF